MRKTPDDLFPPVESAGASEAIVRRVGELIGAGVMRPGDQLPPETALAEAFRVAPMTVRAALQVLREYGLVESRRGRGGGTFVRSNAVLAPYFEAPDLPSLGAIEDFTVWRIAVSGEASARAASRFAAGDAGSLEITRLRSLTQASHARDPSPLEFRLADAELHLYIADLARSPLLLEAERSIQSEMTRILSRMAQPPDPSALSGQSHEPLVTAILEGRAEEARTCFRVHAQSTVDLMAGLGYHR
jgi:DNA-binding FadR family transcriptional regulator